MHPARTRLTLVVHQLELDRASNTGWLVAEMVEGVEVVVHGRDPHEGGRERALVLHPDGRPLRRRDGEVPARLLVPDGTWSQARRMIHRVDRLRSAEPVSLVGESTSAFVRRGGAGQLCTAEAVGRALELLGDREASRALLETLAIWMRRSLDVRAGSSLKKPTI